MMSPYDFDNLAAVAKDRRAEILAQAQQQHLLNEAQPAHAHEHRVWQRLQHAVADWMQHIHLHRPAVTRHPIQHH